jgi:hypothetical protein
MDISEIAAIGYAIAGLLFLLLAVLLLTRWRDQPKSELTGSWYGHRDLPLPGLGCGVNPVSSQSWDRRGI